MNIPSKHTNDPWVKTQRTVPNPDALRRFNGKVVDRSSEEIFLEPGKGEFASGESRKQRPLAGSSQMAAILDTTNPAPRPRNAVTPSPVGKASIKLGGELTEEEKRIKAGKKQVVHHSRDPISNINEEKERREQEALERRREERAKKAANRQNDMLREDDDEALQARLVQEYAERKRMERDGQVPEVFVPGAFRSNIEVTEQGMVATEGSSDTRFAVNVKQRGHRADDHSFEHFRHTPEAEGKVPLGSAKPLPAADGKPRKGFESTSVKVAFGWSGDEPNEQPRQQGGGRAMVGKPHEWVNMAPVSRRVENDLNGSSQKGRFNTEYRPKHASDILGQRETPVPKAVREPPAYGKPQVQDVLRQPEASGDIYEATRAQAEAQARARPRPAPVNPITGEGHTAPEYRSIVNARAKPKDTGAATLFLQPVTDSPFPSQRESQRESQRDSQRDTQRFTQRESNSQRSQRSNANNYW